MEVIEITFKQMRETNDLQMPFTYKAMCLDDGNMYKYTKTNEWLKTTGKFRLLTVSTEWGTIKGTLEDQEDLKKELDAIKESIPHIDSESIIKNAEGNIEVSAKSIAHSLADSETIIATADGKLKAIASGDVTKAYVDSEIARVDSELATKQAQLIAGAGINIIDNVISTRSSAPEFKEILGDPTDNINLGTALNEKQNKLVNGAGIEIDATDNSIRHTNNITGGSTTRVVGEVPIIEFDNNGHITAISTMSGGTGDVTKAYVDEQDAKKQDIIADLADIRDGAAKGATAIQSHQDISGKADKTYVESEVGKVDGKVDLLTDEVSQNIDDINDLFDEIRRLDSEKQNKLVAGNGITIDATTNEISVDTPSLAIQITNTLDQVYNYVAHIEKK